MFQGTKTSSSFGALLVMGLATIFFLSGNPAALGADVETSLANNKEDLMYIMKHEGVRRVVMLDSRADLQLMIADANEKLSAIEAECYVSRVSEIRIIKDSTPLIAGYEVAARCEDAPTAAIALYYDVDSEYLGTLNLAD